jgi:ABC-type transport system substrate-binding protein
MNKKTIYAIVAVVVAVIIVIAAVEIIIRPTPTEEVTVLATQSSITATTGQPVTFYANVSGGTPSSVIFNFGDGTMENGSQVSGNHYEAIHSFNYPGHYLITVNASVNGKHFDNYNDIPEVTIIPASINATVASESTEPNIVISSQIYQVNSNVTLNATILEPPTANDWTLGYYNITFAQGISQISPAIFNTAAKAFQPQSMSHLYSSSGIYAVNLSAVTFNSSTYSKSNYTSNGTLFTYYPMSDYSSVIGGPHQITRYVDTLIITAPGQTAKIENTSSVTNVTHEITVVDVAPGGPITVDPATQYLTSSGEIVKNVYEYLITYNGSSTTQFLPYVAKEVPTIANGLESPNGLNYTFYIRDGLTFSNGDILTAWDVYTSAVRELLFTQGTPGTGDWILAQDLLPGGGYGSWFFNGTELYDNITSAIKVNNSTQSVTFHLRFADPAFLAYVADQLPIEDYSWLSAHGGGISFSPQGFLKYESYGNLIDYNTYLQYNEMGSGPFILETYLIGQEAVLAPNPKFVPIQGVPGLNHPANLTVNILYEKDPSTAFLYATTGLGNIVSGLPSYDNVQLEQLQQQGKIKIVAYNTTSLTMFAFNFNINQSMLSGLGSGYNIPEYYFSNPYVREAFAYSFNHTEFINDIVGNQKYGADFGFSFAGVIPKGMPGFVTSSNMSNVPTYNLTLAKSFMEKSGYYNTSVNFPIIVWAGNSIVYAGVGMWAQALSQMDPNIHVTPQYLLFSQVATYRVPNANPMPIFMAAYAPDYMYPSDYINPFLKLGRPNPVGAEWNSTSMANLGFTNESKQFSLMESLINSAESTANETKAIQEFDQAQQISVNLTLYVSVYQQNIVTYFSPFIKGVSMENSPLLGGSYEMDYYYLSS